MSELNILNASSGDETSPDYSFQVQQPELSSFFKSAGGKEYSRQVDVAGRIWDLTWAERSLATMRLLRQWEAQYKRSFFTYNDLDDGRYYTVRFNGPLQISPPMNDSYTVKGQIIELAGKPMYAYPSNWAADAIFIEERDSEGNDLVKLGDTG